MVSIDARAQLESLIAERGVMEANLQQIVRELEGMGLGPSDALIDSMGFPRADVDLYRARTLRASLNRLRNDLSAIMAQIEVLLPQVLPASNSASTPFVRTRPFARLGIVPAESAAFKVGLCAGDEIVEFGSLRQDSFTGQLTLLRDELLRAKAGSGHLNVTILREGRLVNVSVPLADIDSLGCQVLPTK